MSVLIRCDRCGREVNQRSAGWRTRTTRRFDASARQDFCSAACEAETVADDLEPGDVARKKIDVALERRRSNIARIPRVDA